MCEIDYGGYQFIDLICISILKGRFTKEMLYDNIMGYNGYKRESFVRKIMEKLMIITI